MKKLCVITLLVSSAAFAGHEEGVRWGIGGRAGIAAFAGKICSLTAVDKNAAAAANPPTTDFWSELRTIKPGAISFQGGAFAEVGYRSCDYSFGALIDINGDTLSSTGYRSVKTNLVTPAANGAVPLNAQTINEYCVKAPLHIGGDVRAGKYFGDALWYVLVGGEGIRIQYNTYMSDPSLNPNNTAFATDLANPVVIGVPCCNNNNNSCSTNSCATSCATSCNSINGYNKFWRGALRVGTGIEYNYSDCLNVKLEYRFLWAGKKALCPVQSPVVTATGTTNIAQATRQDTLYFRQSVAALMVSYQF